jgi:hypothetical protein
VPRASCQVPRAYRCKVPGWCEVPGAKRGSTHQDESLNQAPLPAPGTRSHPAPDTTHQAPAVPRASCQVPRAYRCKVPGWCEVPGAKRGSTHQDESLNQAPLPEPGTRSHPAPGTTHQAPAVPRASCQVPPCVQVQGAWVVRGAGCEAPHDEPDTMHQARLTAPGTTPGTRHHSLHQAPVRTWHQAPRTRHRFARLETSVDRFRTGRDRPA